MGFDRKECDRIDQWRERSVGGIGPNALRDIFAVRLQLTDGDRTRVIAVPAVTGGKRTADLRLVHGLRGREAAKIVHEDHGDGDDPNQGESAANPGGGGAGIDRVDHALNEFGATWHQSRSGFHPASRRPRQFSRSSSR
jgi:hypothetical protein